MNKLLKISLQYFAEDGGDGVSNEPPNNLAEPVTQKEDPKPSVPIQLTQEQLDKIVADRLARERSNKLQPKSEGEKLANLTKEQQETDKVRALEERLAELEKRDAFNTQAREATNMLSGANIIATAEIIDLVVRDTAENTKSAVETFISMVEKTADHKLKEITKGATPKKMTSAEPVSIGALVAEERNKKHEPSVNPWAQS